jgi:uncharacterized protein YbjT (DUF2867 family)
MTELTYLITGAGGGTGSVSPRVIAALLGAGAPVRAFVHRDDERAAALREQGADVVVGDLTNPRDVHDALDGVTRMFFSMSVSAHYLEATTEVCAAALDHGQLEVLVNMSQMTVSQMTITSTAESRQQRQHWLAEQVIAWSRLPAVTVRPTVFLENPLFSSLADTSISADGTLNLPFGAGKTSPIAARDVADVVATILRDPAPHLGATYELTGPDLLDLDGLAEQYSQALNRPIAGVDVPYDQWLTRLDAMRAGPHLTQHIATMARLHREDRYNRLTHTVEDLTGHAAHTVADYVRERHGLQPPSP